MQLSFRLREQLYQDFSLFLKSGMGFVAGLQSLETTRGSEGRIISKMLTAPESATSAFSEARDSFGEFDIQLIAAAERSGRLQEVFQLLADYYGMRFRARRDFISRMIYPLVVLNLGILILAAPVGVQEGLSSFFIDAGEKLFIFYGLVGLIYFMRRMLRYWVQDSAFADRIIRNLPMIGCLYADAADARFCMALQLQIRSGISIHQSLKSAAAGSGSAYLIKIASDASHQIQQGSRLWESFSKAKVHPYIHKALRTGETSGRLDEQLERCAFLLQEKTARRFQALSEWVPRILYFLILLLLAVQMVASFQKYLSGINQLIDL